MARLTLISDTTDRELAAIRRAVTIFEPVDGEPSVVATLRRCASDGLHADVLDLVGHSGRNGFLRLGAWILDDAPQTAGTFDVLLRPSLEAIGVRAIRLLGCSTAMSVRGWKVITEIARTSRCRVFGTRRYVGLQDYRSEGFISDDALAGTPSARPERQDRIGFLPHADTIIPIQALTLATGPALSSDQPLLPVNEAIAREMLSHVDGTRSWVLPGLLAHASPTVLWSHANHIHRLEILLDGEAVRAYGHYPDDDHGRIYRVRDPCALNQLLERLDHPRTETPARKS